MALSHACQHGPVIQRLRLILPALLAATVLAGCGTGDIDAAQDKVDSTQDQVDRAQDAIENPAEAARREADRALEDAVSPEDQP